MTHALVVIPIISLISGLAAGAIMHRSDFCIAGIFRDLFLGRQRVMLRALILLIAAMMLLTEMGRVLGLFSSPAILFGPPSLANVLGGAFFGVGMVLAGGCVVGTLYKMGAGSFASFLTFLGLLAGSVFYAEIHPGWRRLADRLTFHTQTMTLPELMGLPVFATTAMVLALSAFWIARWTQKGQLQRPAVVAGYLQPWKASLLLALIGVSFYGFIGTPMGVTTAYAKAGAYIENFFVPAHVASLAYFKVQSLMALGRFGGSDLYGGGGPVFDAITSMIIGIVLGSCISALSLREFSPTFRLPWRQVISVILGGFIMGVAARMAPACNVWHLLGGVPILVTQSLLFVLGLFPGAWLGSRLLVHWVLKA